MNKDKPAFPTVLIGKPEGGMTLRDYFAAKAMQAIIGTERAQEYVDDHGKEMGDEPGDWGTLFIHTKFLAEEAYVIADNMLKAREE